MTTTSRCLALMRRPTAMAASTEPPSESMNTGTLRPPSRRSARSKRAGVPPSILPWADSHREQDPPQPGRASWTSATCMGCVRSGFAVGPAAAQPGPSRPAARRQARDGPLQRFRVRRQTAMPFPSLDGSPRTMGSTPMASTEGARGPGKSERFVRPVDLERVGGAVSRRSRRSYPCPAVIDGIRRSRTPGGRRGVRPASERRD